jgi:hypothetical protein
MPSAPPRDPAARNPSSRLREVVVRQIVERHHAERADDARRCRRTASGSCRSTAGARRPAANRSGPGPDETASACRARRPNASPAESLRVCRLTNKGPSARMAWKPLPAEYASPRLLRTSSPSSELSPPPPSTSLPSVSAASSGILARDAGQAHEDVRLLRIEAHVEVAALGHRRRRQWPAPGLPSGRTRWRSARRCPRRGFTRSTAPSDGDDGVARNVVALVEGAQVLHADRLHRIDRAFRRRRVGVDEVQRGHERARSDGARILLCARQPHQQLVARPLQVVARERRPCAITSANSSPAPGTSSVRLRQQSAVPPPPCRDRTHAPKTAPTRSRNPAFTASAAARGWCLRRSSRW